MDSEDSHDGSGDARSTSSSSSSSSRSSSSGKSKTAKDGVSHPRSPPKSPPSPKFGGPRSPSPESRSQSPYPSMSPKHPRTPDNLSGAHSDINSPENSMPASPTGPNSPVGPKSPDGPKSPSDIGSNIDSPEHKDQYSPAPASPKGPMSPEAQSAPMSPDASSRPLSPDLAADQTSPSRVPKSCSRSSSSSPDRSSYPQSPPTQQSPKEQWRRHTKAEQKIMVPETRNRSRSESSHSSRSSSYNKRSTNKDPATEEISEGEMESDQEDIKSPSKSQSNDKPDGKDQLNISHEDLSDVSDLDSGADEPKDDMTPSALKSPDRKQEVRVNGNDAGSAHTSPRSDNANSGKVDTPKLEKVPQEKTSNTEDGEEQLDFEAEEGECIEPKPKDQSNGDAETQAEKEKEDVKPAVRSRGSSLEEGEVSDEGERRPEESEPRPVCRFFSRGACTWGISCRFLHPGVTDKGNYSMFDVVRGMPPSGAYPPPVRDAPPPESAWERGLRTAKEMVRIANKRKEQDMDFEEKKLHLSVGGVVHDPDAELAYAAAAVGASPPHAHPHEMPHRDPEIYRPYGPPPMYRGRGGYHPRPVMDERERFFERERVYERERAYERPPPPMYDERAPIVADDMAYHKRRVRPSREVIVQRAEVEQRREGREIREVREVRDVREVREMRDAREGPPREGRPRDGRGDEWADPWMRAEPAARRRRPPSSDESYSSSSSRSSRSPGAKRKRRASSSSRQRLSPSVIVRERRMASARATAMNPPAPRRRAPSPAAARQLAVNPPPPASHRHKDELDPYGRTKAPGRSRDKKYSRSSSSGSGSSSTTSGSESESHSSSSSGSSGAKRARHARLLNAAARPRMNAKNAGLAAAVAIPNKKEAPSDKEAKKRSATSPPGDGPASKKAVSRREELLKQLKAVEDAIARKRSKI